jgi:hypothetical protein
MRNNLCLGALAVACLLFGRQVARADGSIAAGTTVTAAVVSEQAHISAPDYIRFDIADSSLETVSRPVTIVLDHIVTEHATDQVRLSIAAAPQPVPIRWANGRWANATGIAGILGLDYQPVALGDPDASAFSGTLTFTLAPGLPPGAHLVGITWKMEILHL